MNLINGVAGEALSVRDRGLAYGDGVFRTFPLRRGCPVLWPRHYAKLAHDCSALQIDCPPRELLERDLALLDTPDCVVKIIVTRGDNGQTAAMLTRLASSDPLSDPLGPSTMKLCPSRTTSSGDRGRGPDQRSFPEETRKMPPVPSTRTLGVMSDVRSP